MLPETAQKGIGSDRGGWGSGERGPRRFERPNFFRNHIERTVVLGELPDHPYERFAADRDTVTIENIGPDDDVDHSRFIFYQQKDKALRSVWPLTRDHQSCGLDCGIMFELRQVTASHDIRRQRSAEEGERMAAGCKAEHPVFGQQALMSREIGRAESLVRVKERE